MFIALVAGILVGTGFIFLREELIKNGNSQLWNSINNILFEDIHKNNQAIGIFYIIGQLFIRALQLVIVPMVFTSITLAMCKIADTKKLGRISLKTIFGFSTTYLFALILACTFALLGYHLGIFETSIENIASKSGTVGGNPLQVIVNAIPSNILSAFSTNGSIIAVVFVAIVTGLAINTLNDKILVLKKLLEDINQIIVVFLNIVISKFGPIAIFVLLTRTFAIYGVDHLYPALSYVIVVVICLLLFLIFGYAVYVMVFGKLNPLPFVKKISKVALFGFSTSSSASTLPLNTNTTTEELGVDSEVASFVLPLGMTVNMNGTAIMQVIATVFIASFAGYDISLGNIILISLLTVLASIGTPAAPGAGAIILCTLLTGMGYNNEAALMAYSLILAINRPIEMLVTSLNVVGDSATAIVVAKSENLLDEEVYYG
ncbi:dicarboxylate/amino acid:cation symporter [Mycoplasmatota bacterium]|nr:dicarboxylate/amino acid:cation symporter [Mycoplasmatota bacterium]